MQGFYIVRRPHRDPYEASGMVFYERLAVTYVAVNYNARVLRRRLAMLMSGMRGKHSWLKDDTR